MNSIKKEIQQNLSTIISDLYDTRFATDQILLERPNMESRGDFATNIAMKLAGGLKRAPKDIAGEIVTEIKKSHLSDKFVSIEVVMPGFINFRLSNTSLYTELLDAFKQGSSYGSRS